jgi:DNA-binding transcriptional ArsR family regulator
MGAFRKIAEERINEAMKAGEFDNLPGRGKPIDLDYDSATPADLRMAFKVLRNAGILPPEVELKKEIFKLTEELRAGLDEESRSLKLRELNAKVLKLNEMMKMQRERNPRG